MLSPFTSTRWTAAFFRAARGSAPRRLVTRGVAIALSALSLDHGVAAADEFKRAFSPQSGLTHPVEQPWREELCLNGSWQFQPVALPEAYDVRNGAPLLPAPRSDGWSTTPIRIPSPWNVNALTYNRGGEPYPSYPKEWENARMGWMQRTFQVPSGWQGRRILLHFEAVCGHAQVWVNDEQVGEHFDNSLPFEIDVTDFVHPTGDNTLRVGVRQASLFDVPGAFGQHTYPSGAGWTRQMIGIWQDVYLRGLPPVRVDEIFVRPLVEQGVLELDLTVRNNTAERRTFALGGDIVPWINEAGADVLSAPEPKSRLGAPVMALAGVKGEVGPRMTTTVTVRQPIRDQLKRWSPESPQLYGLVLDLKEAGATTDRFYQRFGWRQWGIRGRDVTLNGRPYQLRADSGHLLGVSFLSRRHAWAWYRAIKDVNGNAIRLHATIRPRFYLDLADEMGIAILAESEIYASTMQINYHAPETWLRFQDHLDAMVVRDRNSPCVFGWSIANEILSALWWKGMPRKFWPPVIDRMVALADRVKALDPTRPWISSDGDGDFHGRLPTYIYHYGKPMDWNRQAPKDKPFGIGEGGSMVWGSPAVFSVYNGERSYESELGMREGVAIETYWYLTEQRKMSAFCSVFTIVDAAFTPFGVGDDAASPVPEIAFAAFVEGQPGMQPERLRMRGLRFNPGYDATLPLYRPTPVFEAVKAAYAPGGPAPCPWDHWVKSPARPPAPAASSKGVAFAGDDHGALRHALETCGIAIGAAAESSVLVVDGGTVDDAALPGVRQRVQDTLQRDGTVFLWLRPENLANANALLPAPIALVPEEATGLYADRTAPETASLSLANLYFDDQADPVIVRHGLAGPLVEQGRRLIETNTVRWRWFGTGSERRMPVLVGTPAGGGRLLVTSLTADVRSERRVTLVRDLFANLGVALGAPSRRHDTGFDGAGFLNQALLIGAFQGTRYPAILDVDYLHGEAQVRPQPGERVGDRTWTFTPALGSGLFDFFQIGVPGTENSRARARADGVLKPEALDANHYLEVTERVSGTNPGTNSVVYLSFWLEAPRDVAASALTLLLRSDEGAKLWVNSDLVFEDRRIYGPGVSDPKRVPLALRRGWNHVLVKVGQLDGLWNFSAKFESAESDLVNALRAAASQP